MHIRRYESLDDSSISQFNLKSPHAAMRKGGGRERGGERRERVKCLESRSVKISLSSIDESQNRRRATFAPPSDRLNSRVKLARYHFDYLKDVRQQLLRRELIMTQVQLGEINELFEGTIVDLDDAVPPQNQLLDGYSRKGRDVHQTIVLERDYRRLYVQPLLLLEMRLQAPIAAVHIAV